MSEGFAGRQAGPRSLSLSPAVVAAADTYAYSLLPRIFCVFCVVTECCAVCCRVFTPPVGSLGGVLCRTPISFSVYVCFAQARWAALIRSRSSTGLGHWGHLFCSPVYFLPPGGAVALVCTLWLLAPLPWDLSLSYPRTVAIYSPPHLELLSVIDCDVLIEITSPGPLLACNPATRPSYLSLFFPRSPANASAACRAMMAHAVLLPDAGRRGESGSAWLLSDPVNPPALFSLLLARLLCFKTCPYYPLSTSPRRIHAGSYGVLIDISYYTVDPSVSAQRSRAGLRIVSRNGTPPSRTRA